MLTIYSIQRFCLGLLEDIVKLRYNNWAHLILAVKNSRIMLTYEEAKDNYDYYAKFDSRYIVMSQNK